MPATDFDFLIGSWAVEHDKAADPFSERRDQRITFTSNATVWPILDGLGNADETRGVFPDGEDFVGFSLRLYVPDTDEWLIWWASKSRPGVLDDPVRGSISGGEGEFIGAAEHDGQRYLARFRWLATTSDRPVWEQNFSFDDGRTWEPVNWRMTHSRVR